MAAAVAAPVDRAEDAGNLVAVACATIEAEARRRALPPAYFARLIWKESRFDPNAVSPKGAQGIAQFMPYTARERGLVDPFDPATALAASAAYLEELRRSFGNLGLAAAAYNAGPERVARWRSGTSRLPLETRDFVQAITGLTADQWAAPDVAEPDFALHKTLPFDKACREFASRARPMPRREVARPVKPWGVVIASHFTEATVQAALARLASTHPLIAEHRPIDITHRPNAARGGKRMYQAMLGADDRTAADALCAQLRRAGGACIVLRN